jgi:hypothetical protein
MKTNMIVIFRLAGMDGEATEDRVESLNTNQEPTNEKEIEKKYKLAQVLGADVSFLVRVFESIGHL